MSLWNERTSPVSKMKMLFLGMGMVLGVFLAYIVNFYGGENAFVALVTISIGMLVLLGLFSINKGGI